MSDFDQVIMPHGKYEGVMITRVPVSYLRWMVSVDHAMANEARAELKRRGSVVPNLDISGHAIDRASLRCLHQWRQDRRNNEGLNSWLVRVSEEAIRKNRLHTDRVIHKGLILIFAFEGDWPVLVTVIPDKAVSPKVQFQPERSN